jgi:hypothetical protein
MNDDALHELMRREADRAPLGDGGDLRRGRARLRRHRAIVGAGGTGLAAVAVIAASAIVPGGLRGDSESTPSDEPAFAVMRNPDGSVTAKIYELKDAAALEHQLERHGVPTVASYAPPGMECDQRRFTPAANEYDVIEEIAFYGGESGVIGEDGESWYQLTVAPDELRPGQTVVVHVADIQMAPVDGGGVGMWSDASVAQGPVEPCKLVEDDDFTPPQPWFPHYHDPDRSSRHE